MKFKKLALPSVLVLSLLGTHLTFANNTDMASSDSVSKVKCHKHNHKRFPIEKREEIKSILKSHKAEIKPLVKKVHELRKAMKADYKKGDASWEQIQKRVSQLNSAKSDLTLNKEKIRFEVYQKTGFLIKGKKMQHHKKHKSRFHVGHKQSQK